MLSPPPKRVTRSLCVGLVSPAAQSPARQPRRSLAAGGLEVEPADGETEGRRNRCRIYGPTNQHQATICCANTCREFVINTRRCGLAPCECRRGERRWRHVHGRSVFRPTNGGGRQGGGGGGANPPRPSAGGVAGRPVRYPARYDKECPPHTRTSPRSVMPVEERGQRRRDHCMPTARPPPAPVAAAGGGVFVGRSGGSRCCAGRAGVEAWAVGKGKGGRGRFVPPWDLSPVGCVAREGAVDVASAPPSPRLR